MINSSINFKKLIFPFLLPAFMYDLLQPARLLTLVVQKRKQNVIKVVGCTDSTKKMYVTSYNKFSKAPGNILELPPLNSLLSNVKSLNSFNIKTLTILYYWISQKQNNS